MKGMKRDPNWQCYQSLNPKKHGGKYVVISGGKLIGSGRDLTRLLAVARQRNPKETPFVARMRDPKKVCVFSGDANA